MNPTCHDIMCSSSDKSAYAVRSVWGAACAIGGSGSFTCLSAKMELLFTLCEMLYKTGQQWGCSLHPRGMLYRTGHQWNFWLHSEMLYQRGPWGDTAVKQCCKGWKCSHSACFVYSGDRTFGPTLHPDCSQIWCINTVHFNVFVRLDEHCEFQPCPIVFVLPLFSITLQIVYSNVVYTRVHCCWLATKVICFAGCEQSVFCYISSHTGSSHSDPIFYFFFVIIFRGFCYCTIIDLFWGHIAVISFISADVIKSDVICILHIEDLPISCSTLGCCHPAHKPAGHLLGVSHRAYCAGDTVLVTLCVPCPKCIKYLIPWVYIWNLPL